MANKETEHGFVVICSADGTITEIVQNTLVCDTPISVGKALVEIAPSESRSKVNLFFASLENDGMALNHEINVACESGVQTYRFAGAKVNGSLIVVAARSYNGMTTLIREFASIGNDQANTIRMTMKENAELQLRLDADLENYDEFSRLNNELVNLHRTLAKKNNELSVLNQTKNRFLGMAAHDLRNPLGNVLILADFLKEKTADDAESSLHVDRILDLSNAMLQLVDELLDVSSIESGEVQLSQEIVDLGELVDSSVQTNRHLLHKRGISIEWDRPTTRITAYVDRNKIDQVITNFLTNAAKYAGSETVVRVAVEMEHEEATVSVADQGPGIGATELARLFRPFQTAGTRPTDGAKSTGLGLYIARRIVESHNGRIWAESTPGVGSTFHFAVPADT